MKRKLEDGDDESSYNHGASWRRGKLLGKGGFGSVYLALSEKPYTLYPPVMAVKSAESSKSASLWKEREEYASDGTLSDYIKDSGGFGLPESEIRRFTWCILKGIQYIHSLGYVHCDLKPDNVLLVDVAHRGFVDDLLAKISDFGLAKNKKRKISDYSIGGTTLYMAPETLVQSIQDCPSDIWALGCIVYEMFTGKKVWDPKPDTTTEELMKRIGDRFESPTIPSKISKDGKDFLKACLVKKPEFRFTAEMLLNHPFMSGVEEAMRSRYGDILDEGWMSDADEDCSDSIRSEDWCVFEESDDQSHCNLPEFTDSGFQGNSIVIDGGQNLLQIRS